MSVDCAEQAATSRQVAQSQAVLPPFFIRNLLFSLHKRQLLYPCFSRWRRGKIYIRGASVRGYGSNAHGSWRQSAPCKGADLSRFIPPFGPVPFTAHCNGAYCEDCLCWNGFSLWPVERERWSCARPVNPLPSIVSLHWRLARQNSFGVCWNFFLRAPKFSSF
jgi:hypothetical protein